MLRFGMVNDRSLPPLVSTEWLESRLGASDIRIVDGSWYLPSDNRDAAREYAAAHIASAVFFDLDASSDRSTPLPHMLPSAAEFATRMSGLGLDDASDIVVYDGSGTNLSAARVWWMFRVFGHRSVAVLDGGFGAWRAEGRPMESGIIVPTPGTFTAQLDTRRVRDLDMIRANIDSRHEPDHEQVIDARGAARFTGAAPEPRAGMRGGHIPGSLNFPYTEVVSPNGTVLPPDVLRQKFGAIGADLARPIVLTCGSGTSACALALALELLGAPEVGLYDGSWAEWGGRADTPIERGGSS
ncbi:MAG: 3-mercaptopyruvate sulfurtransferase [Gemmatimonadaceae bacterium]